MKRECGDCQLCCTLLPIKEIGKPANHRCTFQGGKGCMIYGKHPPSCRVWACMWKMAGAPVRRPDQCHYVIDIVPDEVVAQIGDEVFRLPVAQVWVDPAHRDAHRDPELRAYLLTLPCEGMAVVRWSSTEGMTLIPPTSPNGEWREIPGVCVDKLPEVA